MKVNKKIGEGYPTSEIVPEQDLHESNSNSDDNIKPGKGTRMQRTSETLALEIPSVKISFREVIGEESNSDIETESNSDIEEEEESNSDIETESSSDIGIESEKLMQRLLKVASEEVGSIFKESDGQLSSQLEAMQSQEFFEGDLKSYKLFIQELFPEKIQDTGLEGSEGIAFFQKITDEFVNSNALASDERNAMTECAHALKSMVENINVERKFSSMRKYCSEQVEKFFCLSLGRKGEEFEGLDSVNLEILERHQKDEIKRICSEELISDELGIEKLFNDKIFPASKILECIKAKLRQTPNIQGKIFWRPSSEEKVCFYETIKNLGLEESDIELIEKQCVSRAASLNANKSLILELNRIMGCNRKMEMPDDFEEKAATFLGRFRKEMGTQGMDCCNFFTGWPDWAKEFPSIIKHVIQNRCQSSFKSLYFEKITQSAAKIKEDFESILEGSNDPTKSGDLKQKVDAIFNYFQLELIRCNPKARGKYGKDLKDFESAKKNFQEINLDQPTVDELKKTWWNAVKDLPCSCEEIKEIEKDITSIIKCIFAIKTNEDVRVILQNDMNQRRALQDKDFATDPQYKEQRKEFEATFGSAFAEVVKEEWMSFYREGLQTDSAGMCLRSIRENEGSYLTIIKKRLNLKDEQCGLPSLDKNLVLEYLKTRISMKDSRLRNNREQFQEMAKKHEENRKNLEKSGMDEWQIWQLDKKHEEFLMECILSSSAMEKKIWMRVKANLPAKFRDSDISNAMKYLKCEWQRKYCPEFYLALNGLLSENGPSSERIDEFMQTSEGYEIARLVKIQVMNFLSENLSSVEPLISSGMKKEEDIWTSQIKRNSSAHNLFRYLFLDYLKDHSELKNNPDFQRKKKEAEKKFKEENLSESLVQELRKCLEEKISSLEKQKTEDMKSNFKSALSGKKRVKAKITKLDFEAVLHGKRQDLDKFVEQSDGHIYLKSGWVKAATSGHRAYIILEKASNGNYWYAHEVNAGANSNIGLPDADDSVALSGRLKESMYALRGTPGRTIKIPNRQLPYFIIENFLLQCVDEQDFNDNREKEYLQMWETEKWAENPFSWFEGKKAVRNPFGKGRPRFTEYAQRGGNCAIKSTDIFVRTILQRSMAKELAKDVNDPAVRERSSQLHYLYTIYRHMRLIESALDWHKKNAGKVTRDFLEMLNCGAGRLGYYLLRHEKKLQKVGEASKEKLQILNRATDIIASVNQYLVSPEAIKVKQRSLPHDKISLCVPTELAEKASAAAKRHGEVLEFDRETEMQIFSHKALKLEDIKNDPAAILDSMKFYIKNIALNFPASDAPDEYVYLRNLYEDSSNVERIGNTKFNLSGIKNMLDSDLISDAMKRRIVKSVLADAWQECGQEKKDKFDEFVVIFRKFTPKIDISEQLLEEICRVQALRNQYPIRTNDKKVDKFDYCAAFQPMNEGLPINVFRAHELCRQISELFRAMPLPGDPNWDKYAETFDKTQRREFIKYVSIILECLAGIPAVHAILLDQSREINQLVDDSSLDGPSECSGIFSIRDLVPLVNSITKARILAFEFAKSDNFLGKFIKNKDECINSLWFKSFCASAINFSINEADINEQARLRGYCDNSKSDLFSFDKSDLFSFEECKNFGKVGSRNKDSTLEFCNEALVHLLPKNNDRLAAISKCSKDRIFGGELSQNPGLCLYGRVNWASGERSSTFSLEILQQFKEKILQKAENEEAVADFDTLNDFCLAMSYGVRCYLDTENGEDYESSGLQLLEDLFEKIGNGYASKPENGSVVASVEPKKYYSSLVEEYRLEGKNLEIACEIGKELSCPELQTFGMLRLFGEHFELCDQFSTDEEEFSINKFSINEKRMKKEINIFTLWLQAFCRIIPGHDTTPLFNTAKTCPDALLSAASKLWEKGKEENWEHSINGYPNIQRLCALVHVICLIQRSMIAANDDDKIFDSILKNIKSMLSDIAKIKAIHRENDTSLNGQNLDLLLQFAENECLSGCIGIVQKNGKRTEDRRNEIFGEIKNEILLNFYENAFKLQNLKSLNFPRGCREILNGVISSLGEYWEGHSEQAKQIAINIYDKLTFGENRLEKEQCEVQFQAIADSVGQFSAADGHCVDLLSLEIYVAGNKLQTSCQDFFGRDFRRLFAHVKLYGKLQAFSLENQCRFSDPDKYGDIIMTTSQTESSNPEESTKIYRCFKGSDDTSWCYVSPENAGKVYLPKCFGGDDFTIWANNDGNLRICAKNNPHEILYATDKEGRLCDMKRLERKIEPYYISFYGAEACNTPFHKTHLKEVTNKEVASEETEVSKFDEFSRFEAKNYTLFYYDEDNEIQEVVFPRYQDASGSILCFHRKEGYWLLASDPKYRLINEPLFAVQGGSAVEQNPFLGYDGALWLENINSKDTGQFRCLLPDVVISRDHGMTHKVSFAAPLPESKEVFWGSSRCGEANLYANTLDCVEPQLEGRDILSNLRLVHIFQTQGEYGLALKFLNEFSTNGQLDKGAISIFLKIFYWFRIGHEKNGLGALVIIRALSRMLQVSPLGRTSKDIVLALLCAREWGGKFFMSSGDPLALNEVIHQYFNGFDLYPQQMQIMWQEERAFWENIIALLDILEKDKEHPSNDSDWRKGLPESQIRDRIKHLAYLMANNLEEVSEKTGELTEDQRRADGVYPLYRENMPLRYEAIAFADSDFLPFEHAHRSPEKAVMGKLRALMGKQVHSDSQELGEASSDDALSSKISEIDGQKFKEETLGLSEIDKYKFGEKKDELIEYFNGELGEGAKQLQKMKDGLNAQIVPSVGELQALDSEVCKCLKEAEEARDQAVKSALDLANGERYKVTQGADAWQPMELSSILRVYGIFSSKGDNSPRRAFRWLRTKHPWFSPNDMSQLLSLAERFLINATSAQHLTKIHEALALSNSAPATIWSQALPLLQEMRCDLFAEPDKSSEGAMDSASQFLQRMRSEPSDRPIADELASNLLLFEYMTGIRARNGQVKKIGFAIKEISKENENQDSDDERAERGALIQQIMGSGKTKVLVPAIITLLLNRGDNLPVIISHSSQLPAIMLELPKTLANAGIYLDLINSEFSQLSNPETLHLLNRQLEVDFERRDRIPVMDSRSLLTLRTAFRAFSKSSQENGELWERMHLEFEKLFKFLSQRCIGIMDEVHLTLNPKESFIIQPPSADRFSDRVSDADVTFMVDLVYRLPDEIFERMQSNTHDQISTDNLREYFRTHVKDKYGELFKIPEDVRYDFARFVCGEFDNAGVEISSSSNLPQNLQEALNEVVPEVRHQINLLRKLCSQTLIQCLSKTYGEHFGYNSSDKIVPFRNRMPTKNRFQDPYEVLCYYIIATLAKGIPDGALGRWIEQLVDAARSQFNQSMSLEQTSQAILFKKLFAKMEPPLPLLEAVSVSPQRGEVQVKQDKLADIQKFLKTPDGAESLFALVSIFAKDYGNYLTQAYETTPLAIADMFLSTVSMSGTLSNKSSYSHKVRHLSSLQKGSLGKIACKLMEDEKKAKAKIITIEENSSQGLGNMLKEWAKANPEKVASLRVIIDFGAMLKNQSPRQSVIEGAKFIKEHGSAVKYIEYFEPELNSFAIISVEDVLKDGKNFLPKKIVNPINDRPAKSEELLTFLDSPRTIGTNPFVMANGHGIVTVNPFQNDLDGFLQAVMRERNFLGINGQTLDCVLSQKAANDVFGSMTIDMKTLLNRCLRNLIENVTHQHIQAVSLQLKELAKEFIEGELLRCVEGENWQRIKDIEESVTDLNLMASITNFDVDIWISCRKWQQVQAALDTQWQGTVERLQTAFPEEGEKILALKSRGEEYIGEIGREMKILAFDKLAIAETANDEIEVLEERLQMAQEKEIGPELKGVASSHVRHRGRAVRRLIDSKLVAAIVSGNEMEVFQEQEQRQKLEQELEHEVECTYISFCDKARGPKEARTPSKFSTLKGLAWDVTSHWENASPLGAQMQIEEISNSEGQKEMMASAQNVFPKSFDKQFFGTENFWNTLDCKTSVFSGYQKSVKYFLISWAADKELPKCHFLAAHDACALHAAIKSGELKNCHLCTTDGVSISSSMEENLELTKEQQEEQQEDRQKFIDLAMCLAHFFNADIRWLNSHPDMAEGMFQKMGLPTMEQQLKNSHSLSNFLAGVKNFLLLRSRNSSQAQREISLSPLISYGKSKDLYALFLAENGLTSGSLQHGIVAAIMKADNWFELITLAMERNLSKIAVQSSQAFAEKFSLLDEERKNFIESKIGLNAAKSPEKAAGVKRPDLSTDKMSPPEKMPAKVEASPKVSTKAPPAGDGHSMEEEDPDWDAGFYSPKVMENTPRVPRLRAKNGSETGISKATKMQARRVSPLGKPIAGVKEEDSDWDADSYSPEEMPAKVEASPTPRVPRLRAKNGSETDISKAVALQTRRVLTAGKPIAGVEEEDLGWGVPSTRVSGDPGAKSGSKIGRIEMQARRMFSSGKSIAEAKAALLLDGSGCFMEEVELDKLLKGEYSDIDSYSPKRIESVNASVRAFWKANSRKEVIISSNGMNCGFFSTLSQVDSELKGYKLSPLGASIEQAQSKADILRVEVSEFYESELKNLEEIPENKRNEAWKERYNRCREQVNHMENAAEHFLFDTEVVQWFANKHKRSFVIFARENSKGVLHSVQISVPNGRDFPSIDIETDFGKKIEEYVQAFSPVAGIKTPKYLKKLKEAYEAIAGTYNLDLEKATVGDILAALMKDQDTVCLIKEPGHFNSLQHLSQIGSEISTAAITLRDFDENMREKVASGKPIAGVEEESKYITRVSGDPGVKYDSETSVNETIRMQARRMFSAGKSIAEAKAALLLNGDGHFMEEVDLDKLLKREYSDADPHSSKVMESTTRVSRLRAKNDSEIGVNETIRMQARRMFSAGKSIAEAKAALLLDGDGHFMEEVDLDKLLKREYSDADPHSSKVMENTPRVPRLRAKNGSETGTSKVVALQTRRVLTSGKPIAGVEEGVEEEDSNWDADSYSPESKYISTRVHPLGTRNDSEADINETMRMPARRTSPSEKSPAKVEEEDSDWDADPYSPESKYTSTRVHPLGTRNDSEADINETMRVPARRTSPSEKSPAEVEEEDSDLDADPHSSKVMENTTRAHPLGAKNDSEADINETMRMPARRTSPSEKSPAEVEEEDSDWDADPHSSKVMENTTRVHPLGTRNDSEADINETMRMPARRTSPSEKSPAEVEEEDSDWDADPYLPKREKAA
ncbi:MAG: hypothetical protein LBJ94_00050 [Puniceicoccales bacterium]|jgi:hypothetical protein|nr:hypothetical protein [Puniceicoccales bacterium]